MKIRILLFLSLFFSGISTLSMQQPQILSNCYADEKPVVANYRKAKISDVPAILELIDKQSSDDNNKIVIFPKQFRERILDEAITKNRIFIAECEGKIIGYKKLYMFNDDQEQSRVLCDEIRCVNNEQNCTFAGCINDDGSLSSGELDLPNDCYKVCIYSGSDFTVNDCRRRGINQMLMMFALNSLFQDVKQRMRDQKTGNITMVYGLTEANAGNFPGASSDRTMSISKSFRNFIKALGNNALPLVPLQHRRYRAFMPTFDSESQELKPKPDEFSIPGFGCVLTHIGLGELHE